MYMSCRGRRSGEKELADTRREDIGNRQLTGRFCSIRVEYTRLVVQGGSVCVEEGGLHLTQHLYFGALRLSRPSGEGDVIGC
jgi:hypothetical protein